MSVGNLRNSVPPHRQIRGEQRFVKIAERHAVLLSAEVYRLVAFLLNHQCRVKQACSKVIKGWKRWCACRPKSRLRILLEVLNADQILSGPS